MQESRFGRFSDPALLILTSLAGGPKHGYGMMQDIKAACGVRLGPGTLYAALARLERMGYIEPIASGDRRRPYRITKPGVAALRAQLAGLREIAATGLRRLSST